jgi:hypothetical protein
MILLIDSVIEMVMNAGRKSEEVLEWLRRELSEEDGNKREQVIIEKNTNSVINIIQKIVIKVIRILQSLKRLV